MGRRKPAQSIWLAEGEQISASSFSASRLIVLIAIFVSIIAVGEVPLADYVVKSIS
jgi:hypothetical protein